MVDFVATLNKDLIEQFRDKANIEALIEVIGTELQQIYDFYVQLQTERSVLSSVGKQLDGIGDIVVLTRMEAGILSGKPIPFEVISDDMYRQYLIFKILKNTCSCTYPDIIKAFKMFWNGPLYYTEDPKYPATMFFRTDMIAIDQDISGLINAPLIKAAGVGIYLILLFEPIVLENRPGSFRFQQLKLLFRIRSYGWDVIRLDGSHRLDGGWLLNQHFRGMAWDRVGFAVRLRERERVGGGGLRGAGAARTQGRAALAGLRVRSELEETPGEARPRRVEIRGSFRERNTLSGTLTRDSLWYLNGEYRLDETKRLKAHITREEI